MQLHVILTTTSLFLFFLGFFLIGADFHRPEGRRGNLALVGFALLVVNLLYLGSVVVSKTLSG